jgi:hypothetical protein
MCNECAGFEPERHVSHPQCAGIADSRAPAQTGSAKTQRHGSVHTAWDS